MRYSSIEMGILALLEANRQAHNDHLKQMLGLEAYALQHAIVRVNPGRQTGKTLSACNLADEQDLILVTPHTYKFLSETENRARRISTPCVNNEYRWVREYKRVWIDEPSLIFNKAYGLEDFIRDTYTGDQTYIILGE